MSGDFVQRGCPALTDKYPESGDGALFRCGSGLGAAGILCSGSAETFARGAVAVLEELGCVDRTLLWKRDGRFDSLWRYARLFEEEPPLYRETLQSYLKQGVSFPAPEAGRRRSTGTARSGFCRVPPTTRIAAGSCHIGFSQ